MRTQLDEASESHLLTCGCSAHSNSFGSRLRNWECRGTSGLRGTIFRNSLFTSKRYRQEGGQRLVMPQDTKWNTMSNCLKIYMCNWPILMIICKVDRNKIDVTVRNKVANLVLKWSAKELLPRLEPITEALDKVQSDKCTIAEVADILKTVLHALKKHPGSGQKSKSKVQPGHHQGSTSCQRGPSFPSAKVTRWRGKEYCSHWSMPMRNTPHFSPSSWSFKQNHHLSRNLSYLKLWPGMYQLMNGGNHMQVFWAVIYSQQYNKCQQQLHLQVLNESAPLMDLFIRSYSKEQPCHR